ncbi:hypothetical protein VB715_17945 [Crocosphaera sp. UHCC 0190]|uniref:hypothetical protein n=1 Tax=Crocosphaera sp. UHCC 0190 TaxID=3110246 RepID=UPI002B202980|nr:hypothetical protein [Crocosphaera sp. UHCC 0190]MEA5511660.1 hypothetical protein [Crocosphaera sp. UHCC 0190]
MNYLLLSFALCLGVEFLMIPGQSIAQSQLFFSLDQTLDNNPSSVDLAPPLGTAQNLIPGIWRGFHETGEFTVYYGYQFRNDGTFWARHRVYEGKKTIEDKIWQGKWEFEGDQVTVSETNQENPDDSLNFRFQLTTDFKLIYQEGSLSEVYRSMRLTKVSQ